MSDFEVFKTTLVGGFDKDDVMAQVQSMKDEAYAEQKKMAKEIRDKEERIEELKRLLEEKDEMVQKLKKEFQKKEENYKSYVENYDAIGRLVFDARVKADQMIKETKEQCKQNLEESKKQAKEIVDAAQNQYDQIVGSVETEVDNKIAEGKQKCIAIQNEINQVTMIFNQAQTGFLKSYKEVHKILTSIPKSNVEDMMDLDYDDYDELEQVQNNSSRKQTSRKPQQKSRREQALSAPVEGRKTAQINTNKVNEARRKSGRGNTTKLPKIPLEGIDNDVDRKAAEIERSLKKNMDNGQY